MKRIDITSERIGRWTAQSYAYSKSGKTYWNCVCDCGTRKVVSYSSLKFGNSSSCGCAKIEIQTRHGLHRSPEYRAWINMKSRCLNPGTPGFQNYGGRGIRICDEWQSDFLAFFSHIGPRPSPDHSVDRVNVNSHYEPGNVRWATTKEQMRNKRDNNVVMVEGDRICAAEAAERTGLNANTIIYRKRRGWGNERAASRVPSGRDQ